MQGLTWAPAIPCDATPTACAPVLYQHDSPLARLPNLWRVLGMSRRSDRRRTVGVLAVGHDGAQVQAARLPLPVLLRLLLGAKGGALAEGVVRRGLLRRKLRLLPCAVGGARGRRRCLLLLEQLCGCLLTRGRRLRGWTSADLRRVLTLCQQAHGVLHIH